MQKKKTIQVSISIELYKLIIKECQKEKRSLSNLINQKLNEIYSVDGKII